MKAAVTTHVLMQPQPDAGLGGDTATFLDRVSKRLESLSHEASGANWKYETDVNDDNAKAALESTLVLNEAVLEVLRELPAHTGSTEDEKRMLNLLALMGGVPTDPAEQESLASIQSKMTTIYATATVNGLKLEPDLTELLQRSRNPEKLLMGFIGWRNATGPRTKPMFGEFVRLLNKGARDGGFKDAADLWRAGYDMPVADFTSMISGIWDEVLPLYEQLHCYTKHRLQSFYGDKVVPLDDGLIPGHLLGNMWSQDWSNIYDLVVPFPDVTPIEITPALVEQGYTAERMHRLSEEFYTSLGYPPLPASFWTKSMLVRPKDREVVCHASAWDFGNDDLRIKMCTAITGEELLTVHHEQGHLYYDHFYGVQPYLYRDAAADFFHEAIGDTIQLSVVVPEHLKKVGLIKGKIEQSKEQTINALMAVALSKVPTLPWALLVDVWRWRVFSGEIAEADYQSSWVALVEEFQGVKRPVPSTDADFDPAAKFHISANVPYIRYFGAGVLQFQLYEGLCAAIGHTGPLHKCDFYRNHKAGKRFADMLSLGRSKPWQEAIRVATGGTSDTLDGRPLVRYFEPLMEWLKQHNDGRSCSWKGRK
ncbi:hypothetical protein HK105_201799 [Polyrhizophydium stewartii]|uniref:Angiotensin-converting enzyme n=1 Tax=Polyrhizophydium stewartii TaxID=2732419 RepID=A0ABR4NFT9_9FUNG